MPRHLRLIAAVTLALALTGSVEVVAQAPTIEYDVKAAFLLNFARFVEWPATRRAQPFNLCTLLPDPFGARLEAATAGETWEGRAIAVRRLPSLRDADCHLLYVPGGAMDEFRSHRSVVVGQPVLLVGESADFIDAGGMIRLFLDEKYVRFAVNQDAATSAGLRVSSRLLRLARPVVPRRGRS
jgi:hypothetical protein